MKASSVCVSVAVIRSLLGCRVSAAACADAPDALDAYSVIIVSGPPSRTARTDSVSRWPGGAGVQVVGHELADVADVSRHRRPCAVRIALAQPVDDDPVLPSRAVDPAGHERQETPRDDRDRL